MKTWASDTASRSDYVVSGEAPPGCSKDRSGALGEAASNAILAPKTGAARWVTPHPNVFAAVVTLCPRDDRVPDHAVFGRFGSVRFRTALTRACTAAGIATFSSRDLRPRRVSLLHAQRLPWARIGELVGHAPLVTTARTHTHALVDEREIEYADLLAA